MLHTNTKMSKMALATKGKDLIDRLHGLLTTCADDPARDDVATFVSCVRANAPTKLLYMRVRSLAIAEITLDTWTPLREELLVALKKEKELLQTKDPSEEEIDYKDVDDPILPSHSDNLSSWIKLFIADRDNDGSSRSRASSSRGLAQMAKCNLKLPKYNGSKGKAWRWWKTVRQNLIMADPDATEELKKSYVPLIADAISCETSRKLLMQLNTAQLKKDAFSIDEMMLEFVDIYDTHALDALYQEWELLSQRNGESISDYQVRHKELQEDLERQGYVVPTFNAWIHFRNKIIHAAKLREKPEITSIEDAVAWLSKSENSNLRVTSNGVVRSSSSGQVTFVTTGLQDRCSKCHRKKVHHVGRSSFGPSCKFKARSLRQQIAWEDKHLKQKSKGKGGGKKKKKNTLKNKRKREKKRDRAFVNQILQERGLSSSKKEEGSAAKKRKKELAGIISDSLGSGNNNNNSSYNNNLLSNNKNTASKSSSSRKVSITMMEILTPDSYSHKPVLFDTGAFPSSYVSVDLVEELGLSRFMTGTTQQHKTASKDNKFLTHGKIELQFRLPNGMVFDHEFLVGELNMEIIFGTDLLTSLGAIVNLHTHNITLMKMDKVRLKMISVEDWTAVSSITASDFMSDSIPLPKDIASSFPNKNLREIVELLEQIPSSVDLTIDEGRKIIDRLLANEYKSITVPRSSPSPYIEPARIEFKDEYRGVVVNTPPRRRPSLDWDRIEEQVRKWLAAGKVEPSESPFNTPHVVAPKKTEPFYRLAQDFRRVNRCIKPKRFPLRRLDEMAEELSLKRYKSSLDQDQAYTQIPIHKADRPKTAFSTRDGKCHFVCFPYGLQISGDVFCERKLRVLSYDGSDVLLWIYVWTYVDDDAIGTDSVIAHIFVLCVVFDRFLIFGITLGIKKCVFLVTELKFGGMIIGCKVVKPNPKKMLAIRDIKEPTTLKELRSFLGVASWTLRDFHPEYVRLSAKLTSAFRAPNDKKRFKTVWNSELRQAYNRIKELAALELQNVAFDPLSTTTKLWFDWSKVAISAVLTQNDKIIRVVGRACSDTESRYSAIKGESLAYQFAQMKLRPYLLSLKNFTCITDHRPLLGFEEKLDIMEYDPMYTVWRERTEQFRSRRTLLHVDTDSNLADLWSRCFPWSEEKKDVAMEDFAFATFHEHKGDFKISEEDQEDLLHVDKHGLPRLDSKMCVRVHIKNQWRLYVPVGIRSALVLSLHLPYHHGLTKMKALLSDYYFPSKAKFLTEFLRSCRCSPQKSAGNPRLESSASKQKTGHIEASAPGQIAQFDVYKFDNVNYLTAIDVYTSKAWVRRIGVVGMGKRQPLVYTRKIHECYAFIVSAMPSIPKRISCDNELALTSMPHPNVVPGPVLRPQCQGVIERFHKELAKLCRIHSTTPDKAVKHYNAGLPSGGDEDAMVINEVTSLDAVLEDEKRVNIYEGRVLEIGDLVYIANSKRSRTKKDPYWHKISRVTQRLGAKTYYVFDGRSISLQHLDNLKSFSIGDDNLRTLRINTDFLLQAERAVGLVNGLGFYADNFQQFYPGHEGDTVWLGYPGLKQLPAIADWVKEREFKKLFMIFPELPCAEWYGILDAIPTAKWYGAEPDSDTPMWVDKSGGKAIEPSLVWWLARFDGHN